MDPAASWCASSRTTSIGLSPIFRRSSLAPSRSNMERGTTLALIPCFRISSTTCPSKNRRMATHTTVTSSSSSQSSWAISSPMNVLPDPVGLSIMMELMAPSLMSPMVWLMMRCWYPRRLPIISRCILSLLDLGGELIYPVLRKRSPCKYEVIRSVFLIRQLTTL